MRTKRGSETWEIFGKRLQENRPLTTFEVSRICGVTPSTVSNWVKEGKISAFRTAGGHKRILPEDLYLFLKLHRIPVPRELEETASKGWGRSPAPFSKRPRILVVEDDRNISEVILESLKKAHPEYEVIQAFDGFQAGKQVILSVPDIVILDLILPGIDGFEILKDIRADEMFSKTRVLAITGYDTPENREKAVSAGGVDGFISKPVNLSRLHREIERFLAPEPVLA